MPERAINIKIAKEKLKKALDQIERRIPDATRDGINIWSNTTISKFKSKQLHGRPGLIQRTGSLIRSFKTRIEGHKLKDIKVHFYTNSKYAKTHEGNKGRPTIIRAKAGKMLAIPIPGGPAVTAAGVARYHSPLRASLPSTHKFFTLKTANSLLLMGYQGDEQPQPWFALKKSVKIPPRLKLKKTISAARNKLKDKLAKKYKDLF